MNTDIPRALLDSADITAVSQLILRERTSRDLGDWEAMRDCFHPDSRIRISWFEGNGDDFVTGSIDMARRGMLARHRLAPVLVDLNGDRALACLGAIIDIPMVVGGIDVIQSAHVRFVYRAERRGDTWRIRSFDCIYVRDELSPAIPGQSVRIDPGEMAGFRPSYRNLSWCLQQTGYAVAQDLPGDDRPDSVAALMREVKDWLQQ